MFLHEAVAQALVDAGVDTMFGLIGDGNLYFANSYASHEGVRYVGAAHEAGTLLMANGYGVTSGRVAVATVTHGPGLTHALTPLIEAVRAATPVLFIVGDTAASDPGNPQNIAHAEVIAPTGAGFEQVHTPQRALDHLATAIRRAHHERRPIVLNFPADFWWAEVEYSRVEPNVAQPAFGNADPGALDAAAGILATARRPIILAGAGARSESARDALLALSDQLGAAVATTVKGKDLFRDHPFDLGVFGSLATSQAHEVIASADTVIAFGAGLGSRTTGDGALLRGKRVIQVDTDRARIGRLTPVDAGVVGEAAPVARALVEMLLSADVAPTAFCTEEMAQRLDQGRNPTYTDQGTEDTVDLRTALRWLEALIPRDRALVLGAGRFAWNAFVMMHAPDPWSFVDTLSFAAIGADVGNAIGAWCAHPERPALSLTGDGGFMLGGMTELNTAVQIGADLVVALFNDGSYGAEHVQYRGREIDPGLSMFPRPDFAAVAVALGAEGVSVHSADDFDKAATAVRDRHGPILIEIRLDPDAVTMPAV